MKFTAIIQVLTNVAVVILISFKPQTIGSQTIVKDLTGNSSNGLSVGNSLVTANGFLYFPGSDSNGDVELYYSDGTVSNATKVDINPTSSSNPFNFQVIGNDVFFVANNGINGLEWYKINGTNLQLLETESGINGLLDYTITALTQVNGDLYFIASTTLNGTELWKIIAGSNSPQLLEYQAGLLGLSPVGNFSNSITHDWDIYRELAYEPVSNALYWISEQSVWKYSIGTTGPIQLVSTIGVVASYGPIAFAGKVYFAAYDVASLFDLELWECDGTIIQKAFEIAPSVGKSSYPRYLSPIGDRLYFIAYNETTSGDQLAYIEDLGGTINFHWELSVPSFYLDGFPQNNPFTYQNGSLTIRRGQVVYLLDNNNLTWSPNNGFLIAPASKGYIFKNGKLFYGAWIGQLNQVFYTDGTPMGSSTQVSHFIGECDCPITPFVMLNGKIYFPAYDQSTGIELYMIDPAMIVPTEQAKQNLNENLVHIFPNPVVDDLVIRFDELPIPNCTLQIFDLMGRMIQFESISSHIQTLTLPMTNLPSGIYVVKIMIDDLPVYYKKLVKQ